MDAERYDLLIRGGIVYDGTGAAPTRADVGVRGDRVAAVGELGAGAGVVVDAEGLAVAPGFIDVHTHDDFSVLLDPEMDFKVMQGVTTSVVGNCGMGAAPFEAACLLGKALYPDRDVERWEGYAGYMAAVEQAPPSLNVAVLVGHGSVRGAAMGNARRAPDARELSRMRDTVREGLEAGAVGFSTGLIYEPGRHAGTDELVALAGEMAGTGALYATHMRDEGAGLLTAVREAIGIGESAGVPVQISHHKAAGRENWGLVRDSLGLIDDARKRGLDVTADQYPYTWSSTILAAFAQHGAFAESGPAAAGRLRADDVRIAATPSHPEREGRLLEDLCREWEVDAAEAARRVLEDDPAAWVVVRAMDEDDVRRVLRHPSTMFGSDGVPTAGGKPHPRLYGTFPRVLSRYALGEGLLSLEEAIHRMTGFPARKFRLAGRGRIEAGACADLVVFDPVALADRATYEDPRRHPDGIRHVFVNGVAVAEGGAHTHARPGRVLRRS